MAANAKPLILYDNRLDDGTPTATDTAAGYDVLNLKDLRTYTYWVAASSGTKYIEVNCGSAKAADTLAVIGHNLFTAGAVVVVKSSSDGVTWGYTHLSFSPSSDKAFVLTFPLGSFSAQYWQIKITTAAIAPRMAILMIGTRLDFERYAAGEWLGPQESIVAESIRSETGNLLGSTLKYTGLSFDLSFRFLTLTWAEVTFKAAWDAHLSLLKPFFFAPDVTNHSTEVYFVKIPDNFKLRMPYVSGGTRRNLDLTFEGLKEV